MSDTDRQPEDEKEHAGNIKSAIDRVNEDEDEEKGEWELTPEEMRNAEPVPMPEVPEDETDEGAEESS